jgi:heme oxygenase (mycobilin-producing)
MNVYMTTGTYDYLKKVESKYASETMIIMQNMNGTLLLHESSSESVFKEPRKYEVINSTGHLEKSGFVVMNNIPVTDEGRPLFEYQSKNIDQMIQGEPGLIAIRVLKPLSSSTYVILTQWEDESAFSNWKTSISYEKVHEKIGTGHGKAHTQIFSGTSYVNKYIIPTE